jgi:hypothetical protein
MGVFDTVLRFKASNLTFHLFPNLAIYRFAGPEDP